MPQAFSLMTIQAISAFMNHSFFGFSSVSTLPIFQLSQNIRMTNDRLGNLQYLVLVPPRLGEIVYGVKFFS